eukprot:g16267.t1
MSPQYAEELGAFQLKDYLSSSPLSAALVVQSSWALLALVPVKNGTNWCRLPSRTGHTWLLALFLAVLSVATHAMWYKSFTGTTPAINTLVWNLDIVAALVLEALVAWKPPKSSAVLGTTMFMAVANMMLNFGWLSFTVLMGAAQAALAACLSMPISLLLDELLLHSWANPLEVLGSLLAIFGFIVSLRPRGRTRTDVVKLEAQCFVEVPDCTRCVG